VALPDIALRLALSSKEYFLETVPSSETDFEGVDVLDYFHLASSSIQGRSRRRRSVMVSPSAVRSLPTRAAALGYTHTAA